MIAVRVTLRFRNEAMLSARARLGLSQARLARLAETQDHAVRALESFRWPGSHEKPGAPLMTAELVAGLVERLSELLELAPEQVLPLDVVQPRRSALDHQMVREVEPKALLELQDVLLPRLEARDERELLELRESLEQAVARASAESSLHARKVQAFLRRAEGASLQAVGAELRVGRQQAQRMALEGRALLARNLTHLA